MAVALASPGGLWDAEPYPVPAPMPGVLSAGRVVVLCLGLLTTAAAALGVWFACWPTTLVQTRIVADGPGQAGRAALAEAALRIGTAPGRSAVLEEQGTALVIAVEGRRPETARRTARSLADALLNLSIPVEHAPVGPAPVDRSISNRSVLLANRDRLMAAAQVTDAQAAAASASLTALVRDIAAGARSSAEHTGRETLDKGAAALAALQLQRIQLAGRYQDDYPAVMALDSQIRNLRTFLQDQTRLVEAAARSLPADPGLAALEAERDRVRVELFQLNERRVTVGADLATVGRALAALPADPAPAPAPPPAIVVQAPLLIEASTTVASGADHRWLYISGVAAVGSLLSALAWLWHRPRREHVSIDLLRQDLQTALLTRATQGVGPTPPYAALGHDEMRSILVYLRRQATVRG